MKVIINTKNIAYLGRDSKSHPGLVQQEIETLDKERTEALTVLKEMLG